MYCIDIITLIINNIIYKYNKKTAPDCSTVPLCSCAVWQKERQVAARSANSLQQLRNTVQLCATSVQHSATFLQLLCNCATESACARRLFFLQRRDSPRAFCCDCASQCLGSGGKKYIACAPCGCFKRIKPRAVLFWISYVYYWADPALFWFFSSSHLKHMFKICHRSPTISYFNKSQDNEV